MGLTKNDRDWMIAIVDDKVKHLDSSPNTKDQLDKICTSMVRLEEEIQGKVGWKQFIWIVGLLIVFMTSILGAIWVQVRSNGELGQETRASVSYMQGILSNAEIYED